MIFYWVFNSRPGKLLDEFPAFFLEPKTMERFILLFTILAILALMLYFRKANRTFLKKSQREEHALKEKIGLHKQQLSFRKTKIQQYNFLIFNLSEVLVSQKSINLKHN